MRRPIDKEIFEDELADFWFDDDGILCAQAKQTKRTLEKQKATYALVRQITGNRMVCLLSDVTSVGPQDKETREYAAEQLPELFKAMAVFADSSFGKLVINTFVSFSGEPIPIRMFDNEDDARTWLKRFL